MPALQQMQEQMSLSVGYADAAAKKLRGLQKDTRRGSVGEIGIYGVIFKRLIVK